MTKTGKKNNWREGDVLNGFKCVSQLTITRSPIHLYAPEEREGEKGLIEQIQHPTLLIRLISQLPGVNYHTHTSRCCSTYIIITVAQIENNLKLMIWGLPPSTGRTCMHIHTHTDVIKHTHSHHSIPINIFCLNLLVFSQIPLPPQEPAVFGIDFIYLMMAVLMTLRTWLVVSQTPQHLRNEDWMGAWRMKGGWYWRGQNEIGGAQQKDERSWLHQVRRRSLSFSNKQGHSMQNRN